MASRILLVDDDHGLVRGLKTSLLADDYDVITAANGKDGLKAARRYRPDLVVLDINMPWMDGIELCQRLRQQNSGLEDTPILFLTTRTSIEDRVNGLDQGGDGYLTKPFNLQELKAHVRALLRRAQATAGDDSENDDNMLKIGPLRLNLNSCWLQVNGGEAIQLTPAEFELMQFLMTRPDHPFSSEQLLESVWGYEPGSADPSLVRWHLRNLRGKIEPDPAHPTYIRTLPRHGYVLNSCPENQGGS